MLPLSAVLASRGISPNLKQYLNKVPGEILYGLTYKCYECGMSFRYEDDLVLHLRLHNINLDSASVIREPNKQNKVQKNKNVRKKFNSSASEETSPTSTTKINTTNIFCPTLLHISPKTTDTRYTYKTLRGDMNNTTLEEISSQTTVRRTINTKNNNKFKQQSNKCKEHKQIISEGSSIAFNKCIQFQRENASNKAHSSNNLFASNMLSQISQKRDKVNRIETHKILSNAVFKNSPRLQKEFPKCNIDSEINSKIGSAIKKKTKRHSRSSIPNRAGRILANAIQKNLNLRKQQARVRKSLKTLSVLSEKVAKSVGRSQTPRKSASCIMKDDQKLSHKTNSVIANKVNEYPDKILEKEFSDIHKELKNKSVLKKSQNDDPDNIIDTASYKSQKIRKKKSLKKIQTDKLVEIVNESNSVILETVEGEKMATKVDLDHGGNNISEFHCNELKEKYLFGSSVELKQCSITLSRLDTSAPSNLTENNIGAMNDTSQGKNQLKNSNKTSCKFNNSAPKKRGRISNDNSIYPSLVSDSSVSYAGEGLTCKDPHSVSENQDNEHAACSSVQSNDIFSPIKNPKDLKTSQLQDSVKIIATNIMSDIAEKNTTNSYGKTNPNIMVPSVCIVPKENSGTEDPNPKKHELACKLEMDKNLLSDSEIDPDIFFSYLKIIEANKILEVSKKNTLILNPTTSYEIKSPTKRGRNTKMNQNKKCNRETDLDKIVSDLIIDHSKICDVSQENTENTHSETDPDQMVFILIHESNETSDISKDDTATSFRSQSSKKCEFATEINRNKVCERETNHNQIFSDSNICSKEVRRDISKKHKRDSETSGRKYDEINLDFSSEHLSKKHSLFQHRIIVDEEIGPKELCSSLVKDNMPDGIKFDLSELSSGVDKDQAIQNNINQNRTPEKHSQSLTQTEIVSTLHNEGIDSSKIINSVVDVTNNDFTETNQSAINMNTTNDLDVEYKGKSPRKYVRKPKRLITNTFSVDSSENVGTPVNKEIVNVNNKLTGINNTSQPNQCQFFSVKTEFLGEKLTSRKQRQKPNPKNILLPKDKSIYLQATNFHYKDMDTISLLSNSSESIVNSESKNAVYQNISMSSEGKTIPRIGYLFVDGEAQPNNDIEMNSAGMDVLEDQLANNKIFSLTPRRAMTLPDVMDSTKSSGASKKSANKDISAIKLGLPPELLISSVSVPDNRPGFCVTNRYTADILTASIKNNSTAISNSSKKKKGQDSEITNRNIILYKRDDQTMNTNKTLFDMCTNMNTGSRSTDCKEARQTIFDGLRIGSTKITFVRKKEIENPIYRKANYTKELCHSIGVDKYKIYSGPFPEITSSNQNQSLVPEESSNVMINSSTTGSSPMPDTSNSEVNIDFHKIIPETEILCDPTECIIETETSNEYENHLAPALSCTTTWSSIIHLTDGKSDCPVTSSLSVNNKPVPELLNKTVCVVTDLSDKNKSVSESLDRSDSLVTTSLYVNNKPVLELSNKSVCVVTDLSDKNKSVPESLDKSESFEIKDFFDNDKSVLKSVDKSLHPSNELSFLEAITDNTVKPLTMVSSYEDTANRDSMPDHLYSYLCFHNDVPEPELEIDVLTTNNDLLIPAPNFTAMDSDLSSHPITQLSKDSAKVITYSNVPNIEIDSNFTVDSEKLNKIKSKTKQNMSYSGKRKNLKYYREHKIKNDLIAIKFNSETVPGNISINSKPNKLNSIVPKNLSTYSVPKIESSLNAINRASDKHAKQIKNDNKAVTCSENHLGSTSKNKYSKGEVRSNKDEKHLHNRPRSKSNEVKAIKSNASKLKEFDFLATKQRKNYCRKDANQLKSLQKTTNSLSLKHSSDILEREKYECYKRCDTSTVKDRKNSPIKIIQHIINKGSCENTALPGVDSDTNAKIKKVNSENIEINDCLHRSFTKTGGNSHVKQVKVPSQCNMRKHVRITCTHCAQLFSNRYFYKRHLNKVHNCTTFEKCDDCKKAFSGERSSFRLQILDAIKQSILEQRDQKVSGFKIPYVLLRKIDITPYNMTTFSSEIVKQKVCKQLVNTNEAISENYRFNKKTCKSDKQNDNGGSISHQQNCYRQNEGQYEDNTCESQVECRTKNSLQDQKNFVINPPEETVIVQYVTQGSEKTLVTERYSMQISDNMEQSSEDRKNYITSLSEYKCQLCGLEFNSKIQLLSHLNVEHQRSKKNQRKFTKREAKYKCKKCAKSFRYKDYLVRHFNSAHESFTCAICCQEFTSKYNLKVHLRTVHKETCATCKLTFNTKEILMKHLQANHNPGVQNNECMAFHLQDPFENDLETELMMYSNVNKCVLCEDTFDSREELRRHVGFHHIQPRSDREEADNNKKNTKSNQKKELKKKSKENIRSDKEMNDDCHLKNSDISVTMKNVINNNVPIRITGTTIRKDFPIIDTSHQQSCNVEADEKIISDSRVRSKPHSAALLRSRSHTRDSQDTIDSVYEHPSNKFVIDSRRKSFRKKKDLSKTMLHLVENESLQNNKESLETKQVKASKSFDINDSEEEPMEPLVYIESDESDEEPNSSINTSQVSKKIIKNELAVNIDEQSSPNSTYSSEIIDSSLQIDTSNLQIGTEKKTLRKTGKHHDENKTTSPKTTIDTYSDIPKNINEEISQVAEDLELSNKSNSISLRSGNITKKSEENIMKLPKATVSTLERSVVSPKGVSKRRKTTLDTSRLAKCYSNMSQKNKHMSSKRISYRRKTTDSPQLMKDSPQKVYEEISQVQPNFESLTLSHMEVDENIPKRTLRTSIAKRESTSPKATPSVVKLSKRISKRRKTTSDKPHVMKELNTPKKLDKKMLVEYSKCSITEMNKNITIKTIVNTEENNERMSVKAKIPHIQSSASSSQRVSKRRKTTLDSSQLIKDSNIFEKEPSPKCSQTEVVKNEYDNNVSRSLEATIPPGSSSQLVSKHLKATSDTPRLIKNSNFPTKLHKEISPKDLKTSTHLVKDTTDKITNKIVKSTYNNIEHAAPKVSMRRISKRRKTTSDTMPLMKDLESPNNTSVKNIELYSQNDLNLHTACSEPQTSNTYEPINSSHLKGNPVSEINNQIDLMCNPLNYVKCPYCTGFFPSQEARQRHIEWEHMNNVLLHKCGECHQVFETYQTLRQHFVNQHAALSHFECSHDGNDSLDLNRFKWKRCLANSYRNKFDKTAVTKERNCES